MADPRGRRRPGGTFAEPAGAGRLGGRRRAPRQARRLPARLRRAPQGERAGRRSLRPLRRRLRARADRLRARGHCRPGQVSRVRGERRRPGGVVRRLDVRRARRRPGAIRAAAADVLAAGDRADAAGQADPRPRQPAQPRRAGRAGAVRLRPPSRRATAPSAYDAAAHPRRRVVRRGRPPLHRRGEVHRRQHWLGRGDVPVVRRDPRGEGLHPWPRPRAPGRRDGRPRLRRPGRRRRPRPVPVLQGLRAGLPDRHRHGDLQVGDPVPEVRRSAGLPAPAAFPLRARPAAALGQDDAAEAGQHDAPQQDARPGRQVRRRGRPAAQPSALLAHARCAREAGRWRRTSTSGSGPTRSPTASPRTPAGRRSGCWRSVACGRR